MMLTWVTTSNPYEPQLRTPRLTKRSASGATELCKAAQAMKHTAPQSVTTSPDAQNDRTAFSDRVSAANALESDWGAMGPPGPGYCNHSSTELRPPKVKHARMPSSYGPICRTTPSVVLQTRRGGLA